MEVESEAFVNGVAPGGGLPGQQRQRFTGGGHRFIESSGSGIGSSQSVHKGGLLMSGRLEIEFALRLALWAEMLETNERPK